MVDRDTSSKINLYWLWRKLPILIRAILLGLLISTIGVMSWQFVALFIPMPWSIIFMIGLLIIYLKFFSGKWWVNRSKEFRKVNFRRINLSPNTWIISLLAAMLIVLIEQSGLVVTFRLIDFPAERFLQEYSFLQNIPVWAGWLVVMMISAVAGICEEVGFRGYMQVPLERRYGPIVAICTVSIVFVLVHLHQAWSGPILLHIFIISALFGSLAYYSNSIVPGIFAHTIMDIFNFSFWWSTLGGQFNSPTIFTVGIDGHFVFWLLILIFSMLLFVNSMRKLKTVM